MDFDEDTVSRVYTIPLRNVKKYPRLRRAPRAIREIRIFATRHMKPEDDDHNIITDWKEASRIKKLIIDDELNREIWKRGIENPPSRIRVLITKVKDEKSELYGEVEVELAK